jgi:hypothetical protein
VKNHAPVLGIDKIAGKILILWIGLNNFEGGDRAIERGIRSDIANRPHGPTMFMY